MISSLGLHWVNDLPGAMSQVPLLVCALYMRFFWLFSPLLCVHLGHEQPQAMSPDKQRIDVLQFLVVRSLTRTWMDAHDWLLYIVSIDFAAFVVLSGPWTFDIIWVGLINVAQMVQCRTALKPDGLFLAAMFGGETLRLSYCYWGREDSEGEFRWNCFMECC